MGFFCSSGQNNHAVSINSFIDVFIMYYGITWEMIEPIISIIEYAKGG